MQEYEIRSVWATNEDTLFCVKRRTEKFERTDCGEFTLYGNSQPVPYTPFKILDLSISLSCTCQVATVLTLKGETKQAYTYVIELYNNTRCKFCLNRLENKQCKACGAINPVE